MGQIPAGQVFVHGVALDVGAVDDRCPLLKIFPEYGFDWVDVKFRWRVCFLSQSAIILKWDKSFSIVYLIQKVPRFLNQKIRGVIYCKKGFKGLQYIIPPHFWGICQQRVFIITNVEIACSISNTKIFFFIFHIKAPKMEVGWGNEESCSNYTVFYEEIKDPINNCRPKIKWVTRYERVRPLENLSLCI